MTERRFDHRHIPIYRVVQAGWEDPLATSFSQRRPDRRWNTSDFPALYGCCSERVARAVALDLFSFAGIELEDLQPAVQPQLVELEWRGETIDMVTDEGVAAAAFSSDYPLATDRAATRSAAERWHAAGVEGVCARSASLGRRGFKSWRGDHRDFGELAIYTHNASREPRLRSRRQDQRWLRANR